MRISGITQKFARDASHVRRELPLRADARPETAISVARALVAELDGRVRSADVLTVTAEFGSRVRFHFWGFPSREVGTRSPTW